MEKRYIIKVTNPTRSDNCNSYYKDIRIFTDKRDLRNYLECEVLGNFSINPIDDDLDNTNITIVKTLDCDFDIDKFNTDTPTSNSCNHFTYYYESMEYDVYKFKLGFVTAFTNTTILRDTF